MALEQFRLRVSWSSLMVKQVASCQSCNGGVCIFIFCSLADWQFLKSALLNKNFDFLVVEIMKVGRDLSS